MPVNGTVKLKVIFHTEFIIFHIAVNMYFLCLILILRRVILKYILHKKRSKSYLTKTVRFH